MLSLISTGTPCNGPRGPFVLRSLSRSFAIDNASGFNSITELMTGPCLSTLSMRSRYFLASEWALYFPAAIPLCSSAIVASSSSNAGGARLPGPEVVGVSFAAVVMLALASPTPPATLLRTKVLRFMLYLDDGMMDRAHFYSDETIKSNGFGRRQRLNLARAFSLPSLDDPRNHTKT